MPANATAPIRLASPFPAAQPGADPCPAGPLGTTPPTPGAAKFYTYVHNVKSGAGKEIELAGSQPTARTRTVTNHGNGDYSTGAPTGTTVRVGSVDQKSSLLTSGALIPPGASREFHTVQQMFAVSEAGEPAGGNIVDVVTEYD